MNVNKDKKIQPSVKQENDPNAPHDGSETDPSDLKFPVFLMNFPVSLDNKVRNNVWMQKIPAGEREINYETAYFQWMQLYNFVAANALTYVLPSEEGNLQDLVYVANLGIWIPTVDKIIVSNFTSPPRQGEELIGSKFFDMLNYKPVSCPYKWEGEADLKYIRDDLYVGGYGIRSTIDAFEWMEKRYKIKIIKCKMTNDKLYHFDCQLFPVTRDKVVVCTEVFSKDELKQIEGIAEIIDMPLDEALLSSTNCCRVGSNIMVGSELSSMKATDENYLTEASKIERWVKICAENGMELVVFNLSELAKASGAALSCCIMHLTYSDYQQNLH